MKNPLVKLWPCGLILLAVSLVMGCGATPVNVEHCDGTSAVAENSSSPNQTAPATPLDPSDPGHTLIEGVDSFEVDGLPVILKHTPGKPVISAGLYIRGGAAGLTPKTAGLEDLTLTLTHEGGSTSLSRTEMYRQLDMMGTVIGSNAGRAYSSIGMKCIDQNWEKSWSIFADVLMNPAFPEDELERQRAREVSYLQGLSEDADTWVSVLGQDLLFEGHPYSVRQWGTIENMKRFTATDLAQYHQSMMVKSRLLFVIVGDVSREDVEAKLSSTLATLPEGDWTPPEVPPFETHSTRVATFDKEIPTSYVLAFFAAPPPGHADYYPMVVGMSLLRNRLFEKIRTKMRLSYAVSSSISDKPVNYGYLYATSSYPSFAFNQILDEVEAMQDWLVNEKDLSDQIEMFITRTYSSLETQAAQRGILAEAQLVMGDWRKSAEFIRSVRAVTPEDIRRVLQTYVRDLQIGYYGDPKRLVDAVVSGNPEQTDQILLEAVGAPSPDAAGSK